MARKLRLEFAGAIYHVISRGNYRADVFGQDGTKQAFLGCLGEAAQKGNWVVHAWGVMSNHYHACIETPEPNLVSGMRWLQATFSLRFNRFRAEHGHVFQGRYKALLVELEAVGSVCHYIHLNPVRAGIVPIEGVGRWPWTSLSMLPKLGRPKWFSPAAALNHAGGLADTEDGHRLYLKYLGFLQEDDAFKKELRFDQISKGWAVGTKEFKKELIDEHRELVRQLRQGADEKALAEDYWMERLTTLLKALGKTADDLCSDKKSAPWKIALAAEMKSRTTASNPWLANQLNMGSPFRLSRLASACRANPQEFALYNRRMAKCKV
jgi:REP element-mobilizing transposase RayT